MCLHRPDCNTAYTGLCLCVGVCAKIFSFSWLGKSSLEFCVSASLWWFVGGTTTVLWKWLALDFWPLFMYCCVCFIPQNLVIVLPWLTMSVCSPVDLSCQSNKQITVATMATMKKQLASQLFLVDLRCWQACLFSSYFLIGRKGGWKIG